MPTLNAALAEIRLDSSPSQWQLNQLYVNSGDFDGDGLVDLAIGQPRQASAVAGGQLVEGQTLDRRGSVSVFYSVGTQSLRQSTEGRTASAPSSKPNVRYLSSADFVINGEASTDGFGNLPKAPMLDLDDNQIDDLLVAAAFNSSNVGLSSGSDANAGRIYTFYGAPRSAPLPQAGYEWLTNRDIPESGLYLIEQADGQAFSTTQQLYGSGLIGFAEPALGPRFGVTGGSNVAANAGGQLVLTPTATAPAVVTLKETIPGQSQTEFSIDATITATKSGLSVIAFDYDGEDPSQTGFKFAGFEMRESNNQTLKRWVIGEYRLTTDVFGKTSANM